MMKMFTFKRDTPETGLRAVSQKRGTDIKLNKQVIGRIQPPSNWDTDRLWKINFTVTAEPTEEQPNQTWKWITLKQRFEDEDTARAFLYRQCMTLQEKYAFVAID